MMLQFVLELFRQRMREADLVRRRGAPREYSSTIGDLRLSWELPETQGMHIDILARFGRLAFLTKSRGYLHLDYPPVDTRGICLFWYRFLGIASSFARSQNDISQSVNASRGKASRARASSMLCIYVQDYAQLVCDEKR